MIKIGIIGIGFMGELHIKNFLKIEDADIIGAYDTDIKRLKDISKKYEINACNNYLELIKDSNAVSICSPTVLHYKYAKKSIDREKHIFIEKPIAGTLGEAEELAKLAAKKKIIAQVGYIERFNPTVLKLKELVKDKKIVNISARRLALPLSRANDVSAIFDLMIHDIDIIISILKEVPISIKAVGEKINSAVLNRVRADLEFEGGINAQIIADKTADKKERQIEIICDEAVYVADLISREISVLQGSGKKIHFKDSKYSKRINKRIKVDGQDQLYAELNDFISAIRNNKSPQVSIEDALAAQEIAEEIEKKCFLS